MATIAAALPLLGLRITAGPIEFRGITDDLIPPLAEVASAGIHDADFMPSSVPWSLTPPDELTVEGLPEFRRSIGLGRPAPAAARESQ
jgi:hypothetical protein